MIYDIYIIILKITISFTVIGLKFSYFLLIHLPSCYRTVCYQTSNMSLDGSISNRIRTFSKDQLITTLISIFPFFSMTWLFFLFSEIFLFLWLIGNKTLFCWILSEIIFVINKSDSHYAVVRFCYHSYHYSLNWTPLSPITITCNCQHLTWGFLICLRTKAI